MKLITASCLITLSLSALAQAGTGKLGIHTMIIGGDIVAAADPVAASTVLVYGQENKSGFICTGSIIGQDIILTAAHCLGATGKAQLVVAFTTDINTATGNGPAPFPVIKVVGQIKPTDSLPSNKDTDWDDIALLRIASNIPAGFKPAKILDDASALKDGAEILLAGYGIDVASPPTDPKDDGGAGVLRKVNQNIIKANYGQTEVLVDLHNKGACHGDSGGPAFIQSGGELLLFGVTSRLTQDDQVASNGNAQDYTCSVDMVYSNIMAHTAWIKATAAKLHKAAASSL